MVTPTPRFAFSDDPEKAGRSVELVLGRDFASFLLVPRAHHEVDALARLAVSVLDEEVGAPAIDQAVDPSMVLPVRSTPRLAVEVPSTVDGRRPDGSACP